MQQLIGVRISYQFAKLAGWLSRDLHVENNNGAQKSCRQTEDNPTAGISNSEKFSLAIIFCIQPTLITRIVPIPPYVLWASANIVGDIR
jgi:hypothetical protein